VIDREQPANNDLLLLASSASPARSKPVGRVFVELKKRGVPASAVFNTHRLS
jgi:hypothetical protein